MGRAGGTGGLPTSGQRPTVCKPPSSPLAYETEGGRIGRFVSGDHPLPDRALDPSGRLALVVFLDVGDHRLGRQHQRGDRRGILQALTA